MASIPKLLDGHVTLEVECLDRLYLNGYIGPLATSGGLVTFMREQLGKPIPSPVVLEQVTEKFREAVKAMTEREHESSTTSMPSVPPCRRPAIRPFWKPSRSEPVISPSTSRRCAIKFASWKGGATSWWPIIPTLPSSLPFPEPAPATVPRLIVAFGTRRQRYPSAFEVVCDSGIAPVHIRSGKLDRVSMRHARQNFTRQAFHEFAGQSIPRCEWARDYYRSHCSSPKKHHSTLRSLALKWIRVMFRCWMDGKPYDEQLYLKSCRRRQGLLGHAIASATSIEWKPVAGFNEPSKKNIDRPTQKALRRCGESVSSV